MLRLSTYKDGAGGFDGCNLFAGSHEDGSHVAHPDGIISFPGFGGTLAGCPSPRILMERQSESYLTALADAKQYQVLGNRLKIRDASGKVRLVLVNNSPLVGEAEDLTGTAWRLVSTDGEAPRGTPPTLAFWDEAFVGGTVADYGFVAQYDKWRTSFRVRSPAVTGAETSRVSRISDRKLRDFLQVIGSNDGHAVREEDGIRLLRIRTGQGYPLDFEELMPAVDNIAGAEWRLRSIIEVRSDEFRYGVPPCVEDALPGSEIVAIFTETAVSGLVGRREYSRDDLSLPMGRPGERSTDGLAALDRRGTGLPDGGKMFFNILATFAEFGADLIRMRTREGMDIARAKGKCAASSPNCPTGSSGNSAACTPPVSIPSATWPSSSPSQDQPSIAH